MWTVTCSGERWQWGTSPLFWLRLLAEQWMSLSTSWKLDASGYMCVDARSRSTIIVPKCRQHFTRAWGIDDLYVWCISIHAAYFRCLTDLECQNVRGRSGNFLDGQGKMCQLHVRDLQMFGLYKSEYKLVKWKSIYITNNSNSSNSNTDNKSITFVNHKKWSWKGVNVGRRCLLKNMGKCTCFRGVLLTWSGQSGISFLRLNGNFELDR